MTLSGRPLLDNRSDAALVVDREDERARIGKALGSGLNVLIIGDPGIGKTTLVRALMYRARGGDQGGSDQDEQDAPPDTRARMVYVRAAGASTAQELLERVVQAAGGSKPGEERSTSQLLAELGQIAAQATADKDSPPLVFIVDDVADRPGNALFGTLRDELWTIPAQWLVTTRTDQAGGLLQPPADAFFEVQIELGQLVQGEAEVLLEHRLGALPLNFLQQAWTAAGGHPRRLLDVARELKLNPGRWPELGAAFAAREQAIARLGRPAHMLATELEALGGASASDPRLLARMGWTRARAVQVLAELEQAGLVQMREVKSGDAGRPRKVYSLRGALSFANVTREQGSDDES